MRLEEILADKNLSDQQKLVLIQHLTEDNVNEIERIQPSGFLETEASKQLGVNEARSSQPSDFLRTEESEPLELLEVYRQSAFNEYRGRPAHPSWLGFHRDGLITVLVLDLLWIVIETSALPLISLLVFIIFGISSYIVFSKQRILGDSQTVALVKALVLGVIAAIPTSIVFMIFCASVAILNKFVPAESVESLSGFIPATNRSPNLEYQNLGEFISDFKDLEEILYRSVEKIDYKKVTTSPDENIKFLRNKGVLPEELLDSLSAIRRVRNSAVHMNLNSKAETLKSLSPNDIKFLKTCKEKARAILR